MYKSNFLFAAALVTLAAIFTGCEDDEVFNPPTVLTEVGGEIVLDEGVTEFTLEGTVQSEPGLSEVRLLEILEDKYFQLESVSSFDDPGFYSYSFTITGITDTISVVVEATDTEFQTSTSDPVTIIYTPIPETLLTEAKDTIWKRIAGDDGTGLEMFGLEWTDNLKTVMAVIKKNGADKFVQLEETDWEDITTLEDLAVAVETADDMVDYRGVSAEADDTYNDVLATQVGDQYFLILVESATVEYDQQIGTTVTINIFYKTAEEAEG